MPINFSRPELAINGGEPIRSKPWLDNFTISTDEKKAVQRILDKGYLSLFEGSHSPSKPFSFRGGPEVIALENEWSDFYEIKYSVSMKNYFDIRLLSNLNLLILNVYK